jgi:low temperature requirement protein LtrA
MGAGRRRQHRKRPPQLAGSVGEVIALVRPLRLRNVAGADSVRKVTWLELFFDLVFVAAVAQVGEPLREDFSLIGIVRFAMLFILIWWAWIGGTVFATRFDTDDGLQRLLTLVQMFAVAAMAANAGEALDSRSSAGFAAAYAGVRVVLVLQYARARRIARARGLAIRYLTGHGIAASLWLASAFVPAPLRFGVWGTALAIDLGTPWVAVRHSVEVPPHAAHLPERFGLFTLILLGECVVAVMHGMKGQTDWSVAAAAAAFSGMTMAFALWWWYFDGAAAAAEWHVRSHRDAIGFHVWSYAHLPLYLGIAVTFAGIERIVHDGAAAALHGRDGVILGGGLSLAMLALAMIRNSRARARTQQGSFHLGMAVVAALVGSAGALVPAVYVVIALTSVCLVQLSVALSAGRASDPSTCPEVASLRAR